MLSASPIPRAVHTSTATPLRGHVDRARIFYNRKDDGRVSVAITFTLRSLEVVTNIRTSSILVFSVFLV